MMSSSGVKNAAMSASGKQIMEIKRQDGDLKNNKVNGMSAENGRTLRFDRRAMRKQMMNTGYLTFHFESTILIAKQSDANPKNKDQSSSRFLMLATTSVWMGCTVKRKVATNGMKGGPWLQRSCKVKNNKMQVAVYIATLTK